jgi:hypothetical protein
LIQTGRDGRSRWDASLDRCGATPLLVVSPAVGLPYSMLKCTAYRTEFGLNSAWSIKYQGGHDENAKNNVCSGLPDHVVTFLSLVEISRTSYSDIHSIHSRGNLKLRKFNVIF